MNKRQVVQAMSVKLGVSTSEAQRSLDGFIETITEALLVGEKVSLAGFGTFELRDRKARKARNPKTGEIIDLQASRTPALKVSRTYKKVFN